MNLKIRHMAKSKVEVDFDKIVDNYIKDMERYGLLKNGSLNDYPSRLKAVDIWNGGKSIKWVEDAMKDKNPIEKVKSVFDTNLKKEGSSYKDSAGKARNINDNHRSNYLSFAKWIIGQYQANTWLSIDKSSDDLYCQLIAKNALFCTIDVAKEVRKKSNTYSWYNNKYRRISSKDKTDGKKIRESDEDGVILDNNTMANLAIKTAIKKSLSVKGKFSDYMVCHIWDSTCYDARYHTSVFNLVLVPTAIAGLTDYNQAVKEMLQYESAHRFGVYPKGKTCPEKPTFFDKITIWRQQDEHDKAENTRKDFKEV